MPEASIELGYPANADVMDTEGVASVPAAFQRTVRRFPDAVAYRTGDDSIRLTWTQVAAHVERWSGALSGAGVVAGQTVAMMMTNRPEHLIVDLGVIHLGGTATSIYNTMAPSEISHRP